MSGIKFNAYIDDSVALSTENVFFKGSPADMTGYINFDDNSNNITLQKKSQETQRKRKHS